MMPPVSLYLAYIHVRFLLNMPSFVELTLTRGSTDPNHEINPFFSRYGPWAMGQTLVHKIGGQSFQIFWSRTLGSYGSKSRTIWV